MKSKVTEFQCKLQAKDLRPLANRDSIPAERLETIKGRFLQFVENAAKRNSVEIMTLKSGTPENISRQLHLPYLFTLNGSFFNITIFLKEIENGIVIVHVNRIEVVPRNDGKQVKCDLLLTVIIANEKDIY